MGAITQNKDIGEAAIQAILAGADMLLVCHDSEQQQAVYDALLAAVQNGRLPLERLDQSVQRILELKNLYQVNADAVSVEQARQVIGSAAHRQLAASCNRKAR